MLGYPSGQQVWENVDPADYAARVAFHLEHGGYSYDPTAETAEQGRQRCAERAATAEILAERDGLMVEWHDDCYIDHLAEFGYQPTTCECAQVIDADGNVLASMSCIDDADDAYRRVVAAELFIEALS